MGVIPLRHTSLAFNPLLHILLAVIPLPHIFYWRSSFYLTYFTGGHSITSWGRRHLLPHKPALPTPARPPPGDHIVDEDDVAGASRHHRDGGLPEVLNHIENGQEPHMSDLAVTLLS